MQTLYFLVLLHQVADTEDLPQEMLLRAELAVVQRAVPLELDPEIKEDILLPKEPMADQAAAEAAAHLEQYLLQLQAETAHNLILRDQQLFMLAVAAETVAVEIHHQEHQADPAAVAKQEITIQQHTAQMV